MFKKTRKALPNALNIAYKRRFNSIAYTVLNNAHPVVRVISNDVTGTVTVEVYKEGVKKPVEVYVYSEVCDGKSD